MKIQIEEIKFNYQQENVIRSPQSYVMSYGERLKYVTVTFKVSNYKVHLNGFAELTLDEYRSNIDDLEGFIKDRITNESK